MLEVSGKTDDLLIANGGHNEKPTVVGTRFFILEDEDDVENKEVLDIAITSSNFGEDRGHAMFDRLRGKKVRITVTEDKG